MISSLYAKGFFRGWQFRQATYVTPCLRIGKHVKVFGLLLGGLSFHGKILGNRLVKPADSSRRIVSALIFSDALNIS